VQFAANPGQNYPQGGYPGGGYAQQPQQQAYPGAGGYPGAAQAYGGGGYAQAGQGYAQQPQAPLPGYTPPPPPPPPAGYAQDPRGAYVDPGAAQARVLRGFLVSYQTNPQGDFWPLHSGRLTVGRSNSGEPLDVPLADATISSRHASLTSDAGAGPIVIEDTGSTNGTFVNDEHLGFNGRRELRDGDRVRFGGYTAIVKVIART
jgi:pSer/pThr/pTyr-binding forkhead associated (FHA) protein